MSNKINIVLADCEADEIRDFVAGLKETTGEDFSYQCKELTNHGVWNNVKRYVYYFILPIAAAFGHKKYNYVIGWQQFFGLIYAATCRFFHFKKDNIVIALNFTYKQKSGLTGKIYEKFIKYCVQSDYLDYVHVPSRNYEKMCSEQLGVRESKFIVTTFGVPDTYEQWKNSKVEYDNYSFAIGRSNRDFQFLVDVWEYMPEDELLVIASDTFVPKSKLRGNIVHRTDIAGDRQFPYIANCKVMLIPIDDGSICSGDTVLLKAMSYYKPVVVTTPSTLAEMYIEDGENGILIEKETQEFARKLRQLMNNDGMMKIIVSNARKKYEQFYSRKIMGENLGRRIIDGNL